MISFALPSHRHPALDAGSGYSIVSGPRIKCGVTGGKCEVTISECGVTVSAVVMLMELMIC